ncbi:MAG: DapH/DapD/GlmU-related protein [Candidatus Omnitrophota bacterium]
MTKRIYKNVKIGKNSLIEDFVVIGHPPRGKKDGELSTIIGEGAVIRSGTVIYAGNRIGENFQTGHNVTIRESNTIGNDVSIGSLACVEHKVDIADGVRIHSQAFIPEFSKLEKECWIGPNVVLTNAPHPLCPKVKECLKGPTIEEGAKIGANSTLLPGVRIGRMSLVGAGSVVVDDVPSFSVAAGNPARKIKRVDQLKCKYKIIKRPYDTKRG